MLKKAIILNLLIAIIAGSSGYIYGQKIGAESAGYAVTLHFAENSLKMMELHAGLFQSVSEGNTEISKFLASALVKNDIQHIDSIKQMLSSGPVSEHASGDHERLVQKIKTSHQQLSEL